MEWTARGWNYRSGCDDRNHSMILITAMIPRFAACARLSTLFPWARLCSRLSVSSRIASAIYPSSPSPLPCLPPPASFCQAKVGADCQHQPIKVMHLELPFVMTPLIASVSNLRPPNLFRDNFCSYEICFLLSPLPSLSYCGGAAVVGASKWQRFCSQTHDV